MNVEANPILVIESNLVCKLTPLLSYTLSAVVIGKITLPLTSVNKVFVVLSPNNFSYIS